MLMGITLSGCLVSSIHPFFKPGDKIFNPSLNGNWVDEDSCIWVIEPRITTKGFMGESYQDSTYAITYYEDDGAIASLQGTLFELNGQHYVDFFPEPDKQHTSSEMASLHHVPVHTLARIHFSDDEVMLFWFGEEWLNKLFDENRIRIDHEKVTFTSHYESNILTAETEDLQKFIMKYMNDEKTSEEIEKAFAYQEETDEHVFLKLKPYNGTVPSNR